jgi:class 3 adenylate cyclase
MNPAASLSIVLSAGALTAGGLLLAVFVLRRRCRKLSRRIEQDTHELERLQRLFGRFAPAELVERIASDGLVASGERREVTVMFADICGFTRLSENLDPAVVIEILNGYYRSITEVIERHHGHVTRLMGDGIMSVFGALERNPWHVQDAVEAAIGMRNALKRYNQELQSRELPKLSFGIGIHCGNVVAGIVGSDKLIEFTVMGDVVNVASRVESLTRSFSTDILITDEVKQRLGDRFRIREMPSAPIKGKSRPVVTWSILAA